MAWTLALWAVAAGALACGGEPEALPAELLGIWRTPTPEFRENYFELREGWVIFGVNRLTVQMYPIHRVESSDSGVATRYAIEYLAEDGAVLPLQLVYAPGSPPRLQVGRRPDPWFPESAADWLAKEPS